MGGFAGSPVPDLEQPVSLVYNFKNTRPIELVDFTSSLFSLGEQYRSYVARRQPAHGEDDVRLFVKEVRTGSIIAELISMATQSSFLAPVAPLILQYADELGEWFDFFKGVKDAADIKNMLVGTSKKDLQQISNIIEPVAKDSGSVFSMAAFSGGTIVNNFNLSSVEANAGQQQLRRLIEARPVPASGVQPDQVLAWYQVRDDGAAKPGDKAVIERFSPRPVRVRFASDAVKAAMIDTPDNPFKRLFVVDVDISFVDGKPVLYRILELKTSFERDEDGF